jgi:hypothetical protein
MPRSARFIVLAVVLAGLSAVLPALPAAAAGWPQGPPNDPEYDRAEENPILYAPSDEQTYLQGFRLSDRPASIQAMDDAGNLGPMLRIG